MRVETVPPKPPKRPPPKASTKKPKRPRSLEAPADPSALTYRVRHNEMRALAAHDYITDPDQRSIEAWYERADRPYASAVRWRTFKAWALDDGWAPRRAAFWEEIEARVFDEYKHAVVKQRLAEIKTRTEERDALAEYLRPLRDERGEIRRHPPGHRLEGLPVLPLELGKLHETVNAFVKFDEHLMVMRGEVTKRTEVATAGSGSRTGTVDPVEGAVTISDDDIHAMSRALLRHRQPKLLEAGPAELAEDEDEDEEESEGDDG